MMSGNNVGNTCEGTRQYLDAHLSDELPGDVRREVNHHLQDCPDCRRLLQHKADLKTAVRQAVMRTDVPQDLQNAIREGLRGGARRGLLGANTHGWALAAAAVLLLTVGTFLLVRSDGTLHKLMQIGLIDHVHCTLELERWQKPVSLEEMRLATGRTALGSEFIELVPLLGEKLGSDFDIVQGHRCRAGEREYVHVIVTGRDGAILSVVVSEKNGESFASESAALRLESDLPIYRSRQDNLQVAAFETNRFLAYVISDLDEDANTQVASRVGPAVREYLRRLG